MKLFMSSLGGAGQSLPPVAIPDMTTPVKKLDKSSAYAPFTSFMWFDAYLASDYPELTGITKAYIFLYCSDHEIGANSGSYWGQGDNLDLSDFTYGGRMFGGTNSPETPHIFKTQAGEIAVTWHPNTLNQQTRMVTLDSGFSGSLTAICDDDGSNLQANWTFRGIVLPEAQVIPFAPAGETERHTGYFKTRGNTSGDFYGGGTYFGASLNGPFWGDWTSTDGVTWTAQGLYDTTLAGMTGGDDALLSIISPFQVNGVWYAICSSVPQNTNPNWNDERRIMIIKIDDERGSNPTVVKYLDDGVTDPYYIRDISAFQEGNTLHMYMNFTFYNADLYYATLDISNADRWDY